MVTKREFLKKQLGNADYARLISLDGKSKLTDEDNLLLEKAKIIGETLAKNKIDLNQSAFRADNVPLGQELETRLKLGEFANLKGKVDVQGRMLANQRSVFNKEQFQSPFEGQEVIKVGNNFLVRGKDGTLRPVRMEAPEIDLPAGKGFLDEGSARATENTINLLSQLIANPDTLGDIAEFMPNVARFTNSLVQGVVGEGSAGAATFALTKNPLATLLAGAIGAGLGSGSADAQNIEKQLKEALKQGYLTKEEAGLFEKEVKGARNLGFALGALGGAGSNLAAPVVKKVLGKLPKDTTIGKESVKYFEELTNGGSKNILQAVGRAQERLSVAGKDFQAKRKLVLREDALREAEAIVANQAGKENRAAFLVAKATQNFLNKTSKEVDTAFTGTKQILKDAAKEGEFITVNIAEAIGNLEKELTSLTASDRQLATEVLGKVKEFFKPRANVPGVTKKFINDYYSLADTSVDLATVFRPDKTPLNNVLEAVASDKGIQRLIGETDDKAITSKLGEFRNSLLEGVNLKPSASADEALDAVFPQTIKPRNGNLGKVTLNTQSPNAIKALSSAKQGFDLVKKRESLIPSQLKDSLVFTNKEITPDTIGLSKVQDYLLTAPSDEAKAIGKFLRTEGVKVLGGSEKETIKDVGLSLMSSSVGKGERQTLTRLRNVSDEALEQARLTDPLRRFEAQKAGTKLQTDPLKKATSEFNVTEEPGIAFTSGSLDRGAGSRNIGAIAGEGFGSAADRLRQNLFLGEQVGRNVPGADKPFEDTIGSLATVPLAGGSLAGLFKSAGRPVAGGLGNVLQGLGSIPAPAALRSLIPADGSQITPEDINRFRTNEAQRGLESLRTGIVRQEFI